VTGSYVPQLVSGTSGMTAIAAGDDFACGIIGGLVSCWGSNAFGQLAIGKADSSAHPTPTPVLGLPAGVNLLAAGGQHACAFASGWVWCWGHNTSGELGNAAATTMMATMVVSFPSTSGVSSIALGQRHMCVAPTSTGASSSVICFGASDKGQVGVADGKNHPEGVATGSFTTQVKLSAGGDTTCAGGVRPANTGDVRCWGSNSHGQLGGGAGVGAFSATPVTVCTACNGLADIAVGLDFACYVVADGVRCWGNDGLAQLGYFGSDTSAPDMLALPVAGGNAYIVGGHDHACAAYHDMNTMTRSLRCWGGNGFGQLGLPTTTTASTPAAPRWAD
jgi:alpha-tubulin suppressor-like RCC1 family protein